MSTIPYNVRVTGNSVRAVKSSYKKVLKEKNTKLKSKELPKLLTPNSILYSINANIVGVGAKVKLPKDGDFESTENFSDITKKLKPYGKMVDVKSYEIIGTFDVSKKQFDTLSEKKRKSPPAGLEHVVRKSAIFSKYQS